MTIIDTSTAATATAYSNQRKIDRCQNGVLWKVHDNGESGNGEEWEFHYSTDDGATWTYATGFGSVAVFRDNTPNGSFFIDLDDYAHFVYKSHDNNGSIYYRRGTPNAARTAWTWSAAREMTPFGEWDYPDLVAHREGTGWAVHIVATRVAGSSSSNASYARVDIDSGGAFGPPTDYQLDKTVLGNGYGNATPKYPSIDFNHTGDGKTVAGGTPHLYAAWSAGQAGGLGIRFKKATYSGGTWTWGTERTIDGNRYWHAQAGQCMFDGTRVIITAGYAVDSNALPDIMLYERDAADTTTTTRLLVDNPASSAVLLNPHASYDGDGNVYFFGRNNDESSGTYDLVYRKWTRATTTLEPEVVIDSGVGTNPYVSAKRGYSDSRIEFVYTDGTASPYDVVYESIELPREGGPRMMV